MKTDENATTNTNETATAPVAPVVAAAPAAPKVKTPPKPMFSTPVTEVDKQFIQLEAIRQGGGKAENAISLKSALSKIIAHYQATVDLTVTITPPAPAAEAAPAPAAEAVAA